MRIMKKAVCVLVSAIIIVATIGNGASAQTTSRAANIKSRGNIDFDNGAAFICSADLTYLAQEIDVLEETYKTKTVDALGKIGTYYKADGTTTYDYDNGENIIQPEDVSNLLTFDALAKGIINSQNIPERTYSGMLPGEDSETSGTIYASISDNLSLGAAAWVEGELLIGTGRDNEAAYQMGYADGMAKADNARIEYTYHVHTGDADNGGGCYTAPAYHTHTGNSYSGGGCYGHAYTISERCGGDILVTNGPYGPDTSGKQYWATRCSLNPYHDTTNVYSPSNIPGGCDVIVGTETRYEVNCGMSTSTQVGWKLGCGKTEQTIESATIVFP